MKLIDNTYKLVWQLSLGSFILAALTGFLYRFGMLYPLPASLDLINIRHAHSHLMFFNWISPPMMAWMASSMAGRKGVSIKHGKYKWCLYSMLFLGFLSYPFFLFYGYRTVAIGSANLPLAAILSGFVMFTWYWFAWLYYCDRNRTVDDLSLSIFDGALAALLISSLGAWGVSIFQFGGVDNPLLSSALTHFFLAVFTEGWAVLGIIGMIWDQSNTSPLPVDSGWLWKPILIGSMLIFPFSLTQSMVSPLMLYSAKTGLVLIVISLSINLFFFLKNGYNGFIWKTIFSLIGIKILFEIIAILPVNLWPGEHGLRILYLHLLLLGIVSITLFQIYYIDHQLTQRQLFTGTVLLVLLSLFMISGYSPSWMIPSQPYLWVLVIAILPVIPAGWIFLNRWKSR